MQATTLRLGVIVLSALTLGSSAEADSFADHPVALYEGPTVLPDFDGAAADWRDYRTPIKQAAKGGVSFAGRWTLVEASCGLHCATSMALNLADGSITALPVSGEEFLYPVLFAEPTSTLLKATWVTDAPPRGRCMIGEYLLEDDTFRELNVVEHPVYEDCLE